MIRSHALPLTETVAPADEAAVAQAVRDAARSGTPVYPVGGGTQLDLGPRPTRAGIGLSMALLNRVVDYPTSDLTITVDAGTTMDELGRRLAGARQWLPIEVPQPGAATIGGVLATSGCGPRRYGYGTIRDYVLGLRAVDGRGEAFFGGAHVVKNAAGYNMPRLMVGSLGTLGVITQATLMVRPLPETSAMAACDIDDLEDLERLLDLLGRSQTLPVAVEVLAGRWRHFNRVLPPMRGGAAARLVVGFDGAAAEVQWMLDRLCTEWQTAGVSGPTVVTGDTAESWLSTLAAFPAEISINVLPSVTVRTIEMLMGLVPGCAIQAHAGNGAVLACLSAGWSSRVSSPLPLGQGEGASLTGTASSDPLADAASADEEGPSSIVSRAELREGTARLALASAAGPFPALLRERLRPAVVALGGKLVVVSAPAGAALTCDDVWGPRSNGAVVMQALKGQFDPQGILNPGRFVFGK